MQEEQHAAASRRGAGVHLAGPAAGRLEHLVRERPGRFGAAIRAAAVDHDDFRAGAAQGRQGLQCGNDACRLVQHRQDDGKRRHALHQPPRLRSVAVAGVTAGADARGTARLAAAVADHLHHRCDDLLDALQAPRRVAHAAGVAVVEEQRVAARGCAASTTAPMSCVSHMTKNGATSTSTLAMPMSASPTTRPCRRASRRRAPRAARTRSATVSSVCGGQLELLEAQAVARVEPDLLEHRDRGGHGHVAEAEHAPRQCVLAPPARRCGSAQVWTDWV